MKNEATIIPFNKGCYTVQEASRLLKMPKAQISRWLKGYDYKDKKSGEKKTLPPLWKSDYPIEDNVILLSFRDLIELRFIYAMTKKAKLHVRTVRLLYDRAISFVQDTRPFSTRNFQTDGRSIFYTKNESNDVKITLDIKTDNHIFDDFFTPSYIDLELDQKTVVRWRPFENKNTIIIDPSRSFGQPILSKSGVPTHTISQSVKVEKSVAFVAEIYGLSVQDVQDAVEFEKRLAA